VELSRRVQACAGLSGPVRDGRAARDGGDGGAGRDGRAARHERRIAKTGLPEDVGRSQVEAIMAKVVVAMSGGVDSTVAAWLLRQEGHEVIGLFMCHGHQPETLCAAEAGRSSRKRGCCSAADAADARRMAELLDIPFYVLNFEAEFASIIDYFVAEYAAGRTPNPCIVCNTRLKFGRLFDYADSIGARYVATGHYARLVQTPEGYALCRARDRAKDQSYVLFGIDRSRLDRLLLPLGEFQKPQIRRIAARLNLSVAEKRESQEICFVPDGDHARLVRTRSKRDTSGEIVDCQGNVLGRHEGYERFTIGQRKGLGVALGQRQYVVRIEPETSRVVVGSWEQLARDKLTAGEANWLVPPERWPKTCAVQIRYRSPAVEARVEVLAEDRFLVRFHQPCYGVAPGQAAVCYAGERVLGGGWIE